MLGQTTLFSKYINVRDYNEDWKYKERIVVSVNLIVLLSSKWDLEHVNYSFLELELYSLFYIYASY